MVTGRDTLTGASTDAVGNNLNLSHICVGPPPTTTTSSSSTSTTQSSTSSSSTVSCADVVYQYSVTPGWQPYALLSVTVTAPNGVPEGCSASWSLNSYTAEGPTWSTSGTQALYDHDSITLDSGHPSGTLTVVQPPCYGQTDFYSGTTLYDGVDGALPHYPATVTPPSDELIAYSNGGQACESTTTTTTTSGTTTSGTTTSGTTTSGTTTSGTTTSGTTTDGTTTDGTTTEGTTTEGTTTIRHDDIRHDDVRHDDVRHDDIRHDDVRHDDVRHDDIRHDDRRHRDRRCRGGDQQAARDPAPDCDPADQRDPGR